MSGQSWDQYYNFKKLFSIMTPTPKRYGFQAMAMPCEIQIYDSSRINARQQIQELAREVIRLDKKYSRHLRDSFTNEINRAAGSKLGIRIDSETRNVFTHALRCFEQSEGLFDVTAGALYRLWGLQQGQAPEQKDLDKVLKNVGFHKLSWQGQRLLIPAGMELDLGGIVKEYAADATAKLARNMGISHGLINLGGVFAVIGPRPDGKPWTVGIANPSERRTMMARIDLQNGGLASSGDYERFLELDGKRYSHVLNPKTGWPSDGLRAVSVAGSLCTGAGAVATVAMLKPEPEAIQWLETTGLRYVFMTGDEQIAGPGLKKDEEAATASA